MAETAVRTRVFIEDSRANGLYLRTTWHAAERQFVISTWDNSVCTGAVRVPAEQAASLVALLADGLADAATRPSHTEPPTRQPTLPWLQALRAWWRRLRDWRRADDLPPDLENVVPLWSRDNLE